MTRDPQRCYAPELKYKPQFAYATPPGVREETFLIPFSFTIPANGQIQRSLPWQLDDDVPWVLRAIYFPELAPYRAAPGFCRIWDSQGNPLSEGLILSLGMWGNAGLSRVFPSVSDIFAAGFPIEPDIVCAPGGALLFDFQLTTNATVANQFLAGVLEGIEFEAGVWGAAGNGITIELIDPGAPNVPLSVAVVAGVSVEVTLETDGASAIVSTFQDVADAINNDPLTLGTMWAQLFGDDPLEVITAFGPAALGGGQDSTDVVINGCLVGSKMFQECE